MTARASLVRSVRFGLASIFAFATLSVLLAPARTASAQSYGTIKGRLVWGPAAAPELPLKVKKGDTAVKDPEVCAVADIPDETYVVDPKTKGVANGVAYVVNPKGSNPDAEHALIGKASEVELDQKNCRFVPHVVVVHKSQTLVFKSSDNVSHNLRYTAFTNGGDNQLIPPLGTLKKKFVGPERNMTEVKCDIHPWMTGWFMVLDHPFFAVTKADGSFEITGVPAGTQNVIVRHEAVGYVTKGARLGVPVEVKAGEVVDLGDVVLTPK